MKVRLLLLVLVAALAGGGLSWAAGPQAKKPLVRKVLKGPVPIAKPPAKAGRASGPAPRISCSQPEYDFGTVAQGEEVKHTFVVRNTGKGELNITRARGG